MKHIKKFESFLNEAAGVLKFQGKEIYPEGYDQSIFGKPVKSPKELMANQEYIFFDEDGDCWLSHVFYDGFHAGRHEFNGSDKFDDYQYWVVYPKELMDLIKSEKLYIQK
jgi:hypothetical protein